MHLRPPTDRSRRPGGFTLLELITTILIVAALVAMVTPWVMGYTAAARQRSDQQTLVVLNDALTRYKTEGGSLAALTSGAPIANVLARLRSAVTWNGLSHQVVETAFTRPPRSIDGKGSGAQYRFTRFGTYTSETGGSSPIVQAAFVLVARGSATAAYSLDGVTWATAALPVSANWNSVTYAGGRFVAVADNATAAYSADGITWAASTLPLTATAWFVAYGGGTFAAVPVGKNQAGHSADGITWTVNNTVRVVWQGLTYGGGKFLAVANGYCMSSTDGINWTSSTMPSSSWYSVAYGNGTFVAVSQTPYSAAATYSPDGGVTWSNASLPVATPATTGTWTGVAYGGGRFVAVAWFDPYSAYSTDGVTWTAGTLLHSNGQICYGSGKFVATGLNSNTAYYSTDGATWNTASLPATLNWTSIAAR